MKSKILLVLLCLSNPVLADAIVPVHKVICAENKRFLISTSPVSVDVTQMFKGGEYKGGEPEPLKCRTNSKERIHKLLCVDRHKFLVVTTPVATAVTQIYRAGSRRGSPAQPLRCKREKS